MDDTTYKQQNSLYFFEGDHDKPSDDDRRLMVSRNNPSNPLSKFVGNDKAINRLSRYAFSALGRPDHLLDSNIALLGPASTGKTTLASFLAKLLGIPFIEIHPTSVKTPQELIEKINEVLSEISVGDGETLELEEVSNGRLVLPPCIIFIDEVHALSKKLVQGLLKATERNDATLDTGKWIVNCKKVCWMVATTHIGQLFGPFVTRFDKVYLELYTAEQMANIIQRSNKDWDIEVCRIVSKFGGRIPREVKSFAEEMRLEAQMNPGDWTEIARRVAIDKDIDEHGMSLQQITVLKALSDGPVAQGRMSDLIGCQIEEMERMIMPTLLASTPDQPAMVKVSSQGYTLTDAGYAQLDLRDISYTKPA